MTGRPLVLSLPLLLLAWAAAALPAAAQTSAEENLFSIDLSVDDDTYKEVPFLGQVVFRCSLTDLSRDATLEAPGTYGLIHQTRIDVEIVPYVSPGTNTTGNVTRPAGWAATGATVVNTFGGQTVPFTIQVATSGAIVENYVTVIIRATAQGIVGTPVVDETSVVVALAPYHAGRVMMREPPLKVGQDEHATYPVEVTSFNSYPSAFLLETEAPEGFYASITPRIILEPRETRVVPVSIITPHTRVWDFGTIGTLFVRARAEAEPAVVYTAATSVQVTGPYVPTYWIPLTALAVLSGAVLTRGTRERAALARGERGLPRRPRPSPKEAALLAELRRRDPAAYKARMEQYSALHAQRKTLWKARRRDELAQERRERLETRRAEAERESREAKLRDTRRAVEKLKGQEEARLAAIRRREEKRTRKAAKKAAKAERKLAKKQAKLDKKRAAREAKERAKMEKIVAKKRKELEALARKKAKELAKARKAAEK